MSKFMMKCTALTALLLFGVLLGIQQENTGMSQLKGTAASTGSNPISLVKQGLPSKRVAQIDSGNELQLKEQNLSKPNSFNIFSSLGKEVTLCISTTFQGIIAILSFILGQMLSVFFTS